MRRLEPLLRRVWPPRLPGSLRGRLALSALAVTAAWVLVLTVGFDVALSVRLRSNADSVLRTRGAAVLSTVEVRPDGTLRLADAVQDAATVSGVWVLQGTTLVERAAGEGEWEQTVRGLAQRGEVLVTTDEPEAVRFLALPVRQGDRQVGTVVTALALDPYSRTQDLVQVALLALGALLLVAMYLVTRASVARALRPVEEMASQAAEWSTGEVDRRFGAARRPEELEVLAERLDDVLDRLSAVLRREQQLNAELSHELRTPIARITAEAELALRPGRPLEDVRGALSSVLGEADGMTRILETLLTTARTEAGVRGRAECVEVLERLRAGVPTAAVGVRVIGHPPVWAGVAPEVLERTVSPLLDNALRHASSTVVLSARREGEAVLVEVRDDGPGVDPAVADDPFTPGRRVDDGHGGAGLGLALARRLAQTSGGDVRLLPGPGGARFQVELPPA
ncbi:signal transduction histidine kinase [Motilibacter peucedani]|uniref:histidine kinase n=1 Tax=Motilibacter peucedani TaxID=598650 RepID=A0A420XTT6_9ACTN|nr:HAMP domain-containing sensor histidine kinase [Motilibacter peucedani]RKS80069.1 signal transduction histidine kinase [Motilibacter peucedani]